MANFDMSFPDDLLGGLLDVEAEEIITEALQEAAPILEREMKKAAKASIIHDGESEMVESEV